MKRIFPRLWRDLQLAIGMLVVIAVLIMGCKEKKEEIQIPKKEVAEEKVLTGKKIVMIIAPQNFRDEELFEPKQILTEKGAEVKVASASLEIAGGMLGAEVNPDMLISDIKPDQWDAIILVGGSGASRYWEDFSIHSMLNEAVKQNKIVGAICIAPVTLANAGILSGKKATVFISERQKLADKGAECTAKNVQRDGNIITASGPQAAKEFGNAIAQALTE
ncbi:MAG: DJ-1/PfpI family protein [candidate division Zixibacteria bacterium]|nr:DJ-1/PfpI family protein [candidate division Zixibacteria bacterium]